MPIGVGAPTVTMKVCVTPFSVAVIGTLCPILSVAGGAAWRSGQSLTRA